MMIHWSAYSDEMIFACQNPHTLLKTITFCNELYPNTMQASQRDPTIHNSPGVGNVENNYVVTYYKPTGTRIKPGQWIHDGTFNESFTKSLALVDFITSNGNQMTSTSNKGIMSMDSVWFTWKPVDGQLVSAQIELDDDRKEEEDDNVPNYHSVDVTVTNQ